MKRKHKSYSRPKRPFDKQRIIEEGELKKNFGLKNKREIWKIEARVKSMREKAKKLIGVDIEKQKKLFEQLKKIGLNVNSIADVLALTKEDYLGRRLQTILIKKNLATTPRGARQLIVHKKVLVDDKAVNIPSYLVPIALENKITLKKKKIKMGEIKVEEVSNE